MSKYGVVCLNNSKEDGELAYPVRDPSYAHGVLQSAALVSLGNGREVWRWPHWFVTLSSLGRQYTLLISGNSMGVRHTRSGLVMNKIRVSWRVIVYASVSTFVQISAVASMPSCLRNQVDLGDARKLLVWSHAVAVQVPHPWSLYSSPSETGAWPSIQPFGASVVCVNGRCGSSLCWIYLNR